VASRHSLEVDSYRSPRWLTDEVAAMVSMRSAWAASCALVPLLFAGRALADDKNKFTFPARDGYIFNEGDTVIVSYESAMKEVVMWTFCWEKNDKNEDTLMTSTWISQACQNEGMLTNGARRENHRGRRGPERCSGD
jgi:hypothetical protein